MNRKTFFQYSSCAFQMNDVHTFKFYTSSSTQEFSKGSAILDPFLFECILFVPCSSFHFWFGSERVREFQKLLIKRIRQVWRCQLRYSFHVGRQYVRACAYAREANHFAAQFSKNLLSGDESSLESWWKTVLFKSYSKARRWPYQKRYL